MKTSSLLILMLFALLACNGCSDKTNNTPSVSVQDNSSDGFGNPRFTTIRFDAGTERIELFLRDDAGHPLRRFDRLESWLASRNERLRFAMNAGMFEPDLSPVGLLVQNGQQVSPLNLSDGTGNFFLKPSGVFFISE